MNSTRQQNYTEEYKAYTRKEMFALVTAAHIIHHRTRHLLLCPMRTDTTNP